nr:hypothetical protein [Tanacetum cinerariifolium]
MPPSPRRPPTAAMALISSTTIHQPYHPCYLHHHHTKDPLQPSHRHPHHDITATPQLTPPPSSPTEIHLHHRRSSPSSPSRHHNHRYLTTATTPPPRLSQPQLWDTLKAKYMAEDASSKKFLVSCIIDKLSPSWKDLKYTLKHLKEELTLIELGNHLHIKESLRVQDNDKLKGNNLAGPSVANMVEHKNSSRYNDNKGKRKHHDTRADPNKKPKMTCWKCGKPGHLKWDCKAVVKLPNPNLKTFGKRGIECNFVGYAEHSKAFRFYVIEPNDSIAINSIIESNGVIFNKNRFSSVPKPSQRSLVKGTKDSGGLVVPRKVTNEDDPKTFDEAMKSQNIAFWKEKINDEIDSIMGNNTWVLTDLPPGCRPLGCKWICKRKLKVDRTIEKFKARLVIQGFKQDSKIYYFDPYALLARGPDKGIFGIKIFYEGHGEVHVIFVNTPMNTSEKLMPNNGQPVSQLEYSRVIRYLIKLDTLYPMEVDTPYQGRFMTFDKYLGVARESVRNGDEIPCSLWHCGCCFTRLEEMRIKRRDSEQWIHHILLAQDPTRGIVKELQNLHPEGINNTVADVHDQHGDTRLDVDNTSC